MTILLALLAALVLTQGMRASGSDATSHPTLIREGGEAYLRPSLWAAPKPSLMVRFVDWWHSIFG